MSLTFFSNSRVLDDLLDGWGFRSAVPEVEGFRWISQMQTHSCGGSVCWVWTKRALVWGLPCWLPLLLSVWLLFPTPRPSRAALPRCSNPGVLMWFAAFLNSHSSQLRARNASLMSFFQLLRHFKGVVEAYEKKIFFQHYLSEKQHILWYWSPENKNQINIFFQCVF